MRRIIEVLPRGRYWRLWGLTTVITFGFFSEAKVRTGGGGLILPNVGVPKVCIEGWAQAGLTLPRVGAPKARVGSGVRVNVEQHGK